MNVKKGGTVTDGTVADGSVAGGTVADGAVTGGTVAGGTVACGSVAISTSAVGTSASRIMRRVLDAGLEIDSKPAYQHDRRECITLPLCLI